MKSIVAIFLNILLLVFTENPALAGVSSVDLIEKGKEYNGKEILFEGEAIRESMVRGKYAWLNVSDGDNTIGVWVKSRLIRDIDKFGSYHVKGDQLQVKGVFYRSCPEHGGDMDIHADSLLVIKEGYQVSHTIEIKRLVLAFFFIVSAVTLYFTDKYRKSGLCVD